MSKTTRFFRSQILGVGYGEKNQKKILRYARASSILCSEKELEKNKQLQLICQNQHNKYYYVRNTNTVIMKVEDKFCILIDYKVCISKNKKVGVLAFELAQYLYYVYQKDNTDRDIVNRGTNGHIAYDIQEIIHGTQQVLSWKEQKYTVDHEAETYNEKAEHTRYKEVNFNHGSHRLGVWIENQRDLNVFIDDIRISEQQQNGVYYDKHNRRKMLYRNFVF